MAINCGVPMVRLTLIVLNLFCLVTGLSLAIVGIVMYHRLPSTGNSSDQDENLHVNQAILAISIGWVIFVVAFFGFCGAAQHSYCMIVAYGLLLMALIVTQIVVAVLLFANVDAGRSRYLEWFELNLETSNTTGLVDPTFDRLQRAYECCGIDSYRDWGGNIPDSCCSEGKGPSCVPYKHGCKRVLEGYIRQAAIAVGWILIGLTLFEGIALTMACCLANDIKKPPPIHRNSYTTWTI